MSAPRAAREPRWLWGLWLCVVAIETGPMFRQPTAFPGVYDGAYDMRYFLTWVEIARRTVAWFGEFPLWNPWVCGGMPHLGNPQSTVAAPSFVLALVFGTALGIKLMLAGYLLIACDGMYRLSRHQGLERTGAVAAALLFATGGWFAIRLGTGHLNFASAALFPYLLLVYFRSRTEWEWSLPLGAIMAWVFALGGTSTPAMAMILLGTVAAWDMLERRSLRPALGLVSAAVVCALVGAFRLVPTFEFALDHPRPKDERDANNILEIIRNGYWWRGIKPVASLEPWFHGKKYWFHEYGYKLSYLTIPLLLSSMRLRKAWRWWLVAVVGGAIVAGEALPYGPWWMLRHLPFFRELRVPSRYAVMLALALPLCAGVALDDLAARVRRLARRAGAPLVVTGVLISAMTLEQIVYGWGLFGGHFTFEAEVATPGTPFYRVEGHWAQMMDLVLRNRGVMKCDEEAPLQRALTLDLGPVPQVRLEDPSAGELGDLEWSPNRMAVDVQLERPALVLFNSNWNEHWRTSHGAIAKVGPKVERDRDGGRLGVDAPAGRYRLEVVYRPRSFVVGAAVSSIAAPALLLGWILVRRRRRRTDETASA